MEITRSSSNINTLIGSRCAGSPSFPKVFAEVVFEYHDKKYVPVVHFYYKTAKGVVAHQSEIKLIHRMKVKMLHAFKDRFAPFYIRFSPNRVVEQVISISGGGIIRFPAFKDK